MTTGLGREPTGIYYSVKNYFCVCGTGLSAALVYATRQLESTGLFALLLLSVQQTSMASKIQQPSSLELSRFNDDDGEGTRGPARGCATRLAEVLQYPMFSTDQHLFCSMPIISKACRAAARTANTINLAASVSTAKGMTGICSFSRWLPRYYSIPHSIRIQGGTSGGVNIETADSVLSLSLQLAAAKAREEGSRLQLHMYCSDVFIGRDVMLNLPQDTLTSLQFTNIRSSNMADLSIGLQHLTNLRSLQLIGFEHDAALAVDVCMPAIGQLTNLADLELQDVASFSYEQLPAQQLQRLVVAYSDDNPEKVVAAFSHLTRLSYLSLDMGAVQDVELGPLPVQLVKLKLNLNHSLWTTSATSLNISAVVQLRKVFFGFSYQTADCLLALKALPNLQHVVIHSIDIASLIEASESATWSRLPQLHSVHLNDDLEMPVASLGQLMHNISGTTSLTRLVLEDCEIRGPGPLPPFCRGLANLSGLRELALQFSVVQQADFVPNDVQKLSALTKLTQLHLKPVASFVMDDDVVVLALHLQRLQKLYVPVRSVPVLAAICHGGSKALQVVGTYISSTLEQDVAWQRYMDESHFHVEVVYS